MTTEELAFLLALAQPLIFFLAGALAGPIVARIWWATLRDRHRADGDGGAARAPAEPAAPAAPSPAARPATTEGVRWLLVGNPGSGKTAAARYLARSFVARGAEVLVLDIEGERWPRGCRMRGAPDDFPVIATELQAVAAQAASRRGAFQRGERVFPPLVVIIDELPRVLTGVRGATELLTDLCLRGRKLNISLIALTQATGAKLTGLEGKTELLRQFRRFDVRRAGGVVELVEGERVTLALELTAELDLVLPILEDEPTPDAERLLAAALATPVPVTGPRRAADPAPVQADLLPLPVPGTPGTAHQDAQQAAPPEPPPPSPVEPAPAEAEGGDEQGGGLDAEVIRFLHASGWSKNKIASKLRGTRAKRWATITAALGE